MLIDNPNVFIGHTVGLVLLVPGNVHRTETAKTTLSGKAVNVASVAYTFGHRAAILGFLPTNDASVLGELDAGKGTGVYGIDIDGTTRDVWCPAPKVQVVNPTRVSDSLVGGLLHALELCEPFDQAVRFALAVASAAYGDSLTGGLDDDRVAALLSGLPPTELPAHDLPAGMEP
jgi:fructose-1-phosphate kinase PfkB-like protein